MPTASSTGPSVLADIYAYLSLTAHRQTNKLCAHLNRHSNANHVDRNSLNCAEYSYPVRAPVPGPCLVPTLTCELCFESSNQQARVTCVSVTRTQLILAHTHIHTYAYTCSRYAVNLSGHGTMCRKLNVRPSSSSARQALMCVDVLVPALAVCV